MANANKSNREKNSTPVTSAFDKLTKAQLIKIFANLFAKSKTIRIFVSANILKSVSDTVLYFIAKFPFGCIGIDSVCLPKHKGASLLLCTYIN